MKKKLFIGMLFLSLFIICYLQLGRDVSAATSFVMSSDNGYSMDVDIIANKLLILNKEKFAKDIIKRCNDNSIDGIRFSYDMRGYPNELNLTIYNSRWARKHEKITFKVTYEQIAGEVYKYNIKDNPDKFRLIITE